MNIKNFKNQTKKTLKDNNWVKAVGMSVILISSYILIYFVSIVLYRIFDINYNDGIFANFISNNFHYTSNYLYLSIIRIVIFFLFFMLSPIWLGFNRWCLLTSRGKNIPVYEMFYYFEFGERYFNALAVYAKSVVKIIIVAVISCSPGFFLMGHGINIIIQKSFEPWQYHLVIALSIIIFIAGVLVTILFMSRYSLAGYIYILKPECSPKKCVTLSVMLTKKYKDDYVKLYISYIPYMIMCLIVFPIIFVLPYCKMTTSIMADKILTTNNNKIKIDIL